MSVHTTEDELYHLMSKYGPLERVQVVIDAKTGSSRGFAFVYFENTDDAELDKEQCTGMKTNGKSIRVDYSITERAHTPTPGIYIGKPTYKYCDRYGRRHHIDIHEADNVLEDTADDLIQSAQCQAEDDTLEPAIIQNPPDVQRYLV